MFASHACVRCAVTARLKTPPAHGKEDRAAGTSPSVGFEKQLNDVCSIHSTDFNAYVTKAANGSIVMIALRDIRVGEEVRRYR